MEQSESVLSKLQEDGYDRTSLQQGAASLLPNFAQSSQLQSQRQAEDNFLFAAMRKDSGANIPTKELEMERRRYFPAAGDSPEVVEQKKITRAQKIESLRAEAGKAYNQVKSITGQDGRAPDVKKKHSDPRVQKALDAGYSMEQIQEYLKNGKR